MEKALDWVQATTGTASRKQATTPVYDTIAFLTCMKCFTLINVGENDEANQLLLNACSKPIKKIC